MDIGYTFKAAIILPPMEKQKYPHFRHTTCIPVHGHDSKFEKLLSHCLRESRTTVPQQITVIIINNNNNNK